MVVLYEFTFEDSTNMTDEEVLKVLEVDMLNEAAIQGWPEGYKLIQTGHTITLPNGHKKREFVVVL